MEPVDIAEVAASVSERAFAYLGCNARVARVLDDNDGRTTVEIALSDSPVAVDGFWPEGCALSDEKKRALFWQYHRAMGCDEYTSVLAQVIKGICDNGAPLSHEGRPVVDVLVLNSTEFDVSNLLAARGDDAPLRVHDPVSGATVPIIATHETMDELNELGEAACLRMGMNLPPPDRDSHRVKMKRHRPEAYTGTVPHWWVAAVVEGVSDKGKKEWIMVHLDLCGVAYNSTAFVPAPGGDTSLVPLQVFCTPEYFMMSNEESLRHKLVLNAFLSVRNVSAKDNTRIALQPKSVRHFRCYHKDDTSTIEVTPLATFVERRSNDDAVDTKVNAILQSVLSDIMMRVRAGVEVVLCNIQSKPELNGRSGVVHKAVEKIRQSNGRIPVLVRGSKGPIQLKPTCIRLPTKRKQYRTLEEFRAEQESLMKHVQHDASWSQKQKKQLRSTLDKNDPAVAKVLTSMQTGQMGFTQFADLEFKRGVRMMVRPPLNALFPEGMVPKLQAGLELSDHPKARDAIKIINLLKTCKQRFLEENPNLVRGDGALVVQPGSELMRVQMGVVSKIRSDSELGYVFERLDELGLFVNPAK